MDPITHTLAGAVLSRTRLGRPHPRAPSHAAAGPSTARRWWTGTTLMLGANLPDVDVVCYFVSSDFALAHRRGWTHGVLAMAVLPVVLALLVLGVARLVERVRKRPAVSLPPFRRLLFLSAIGVWSHPLLDWLNTYGVRFLAPFDWSWFYGDSVFIVDPWIWLLLAGGLVLGRKKERVATVALAAAGLYVGLLIVSSAAGRATVREAMADRRPEAEVRDLMVGPLLADPFRKDVIVETDDGFRVGRLDWLAGGDLHLRPETYPGAEPTNLPPALVRQALDDPSIDGFTSWMRYPSGSLAPEGDGAVRVHLVDLRYARRPGTGFGTASVVVRPVPTHGH